MGILSLIWNGGSILRGNVQILHLFYTKPMALQTNSRSSCHLLIHKAILHTSSPIPAQQTQKHSRLLQHSIQLLIELVFMASKSKHGKSAPVISEVPYQALVGNTLGPINTQNGPNP